MRHIRNKASLRDLDVFLYLRNNGIELLIFVFDSSEATDVWHAWIFHWVL